MFHLTEKTLLRSSFALALVLLGSMAVTSIFAIQCLGRDRAQVIRTRNILDELRNTFNEMRFAEGGRRGYLLTQKNQYLQTFQRGQTKTYQHLNHLHQIISTDPVLSSRIDQLDPMIQTRLELIQQSIVHYQQHPEDTATQIQLTDSGFQQQTAIWQKIEAIIDDETVLLLQQRASTDRLIHNLAFLEAVTAGISLSLLFGAYYLLQKQIQQRNYVQQELETANLALKRSNQDLEEFAYIASHDLQEPLRVVARYAQELSCIEGLDATAQADLDRIIQRVGQMRSLIRSLLTYAKLDNSKEQPVQTDLNQILNIVLSNLQEKIQQTTITATPLPTLWVRPTEWVQLFQNLISNAIDAKQDASLLIQIGADTQAANWLFWATDNGKGIRPEDLDRLFTPFNRLTSHSGTGMGLAICQKIVNRHNGKIWAESEWGKGTAIYISMPGINNFDV
jgi:signal transduction histidine kinase